MEHGGAGRNLREHRRQPRLAAVPRVASLTDRKRIARTFLKLCATGKLRQAYEGCVAPGFIHHNPYFPAAEVRHEPGARPIAVVHIMRFRGERIAELWDVAVEEPADSPNENGMF